MAQIANRVFELGTESALDVLLKAKALEAKGRKVIHLEVGEPDFPTPPHIVEAGVKALREGRTRYGAAPGNLDLREALAEHLRERGAEADAERVLVTPGAKPILFYALLATVSQGDEVLIPDPGFPIYPSMVRFCGGVPVPIPPMIAEGKPMNLDVLEASITPRTRAVIINSPSNPTGASMSGADLERLAALAQKHDLWVIADEIYRRISYGPTPASIAALPGMGERTIIIDGFSKAYAMTGWRLGYGLFPAALAQHAVRLMINSNTCTATFVQDAGLAALRGPQDVVSRMTAEFQARRDAVVKWLSAIPRVTCHVPDGAFYVFPDVRALPLSSKELADKLLEEEGVALLDGGGFGGNGRGHLRLSFAASLASLEEAAKRFASLPARL
jgi:aspartate aminotransferase